MPTANDPLDCVCQHLRRTTRSVTAYFDDALRPSGLRSTQYTLLHLVSLKEGISLVPLARKAGMDRTTLTRSLQTLEQLGFVGFSEDEHDKRKLLAHLTDEGRTAMDTAHPLWRKAQTRTLKILSRKSWDKLYRRLEIIDVTLEGKAASIDGKAKGREKKAQRKAVAVLAETTPE